ncbi:BTB/POZ domain-containing protein [Rhynchospora pubera]|uniref:BTB/POZ domain-containing protein n=1 Tax=Rhynchospora pubera TaxID=906938 RepID=A0AAV8GJW1_9POAL|nr:BTB/POZ domain-containing protein [Rhynchospora pubera]
MSTNPIITLNIGGTLFHTTHQTLSLTGPTSPLSSLPLPSPSSPPPFFDRDPDLFSHLLSFLRSGLPPSPSLLPSLLAEAEFFSFPPPLLSKLSLPLHFNPFALSPSLSLHLNGRDRISSVSVSPSSSVLSVAHGCKVTTFTPSLLHKSTVLTPLPFIDVVLPLTSSLGAAGAKDFPGLHLVNLLETSPPEVLHWAPHPSLANSSTVLAIGYSPNLLFSSFESCRRNSNAIVAFDLEKFEPVLEIGRKEIFAAEIDTAIPATKLSWINNLGLLMAAGSHAGPAGFSGYVKFFDTRANRLAFEIEEKNSDCFADVAASDSLLSVFKVGVSSGDVYVTDLRKIESFDNWTLIGEGRRSGDMKKKEGLGCKMECYEKNVFVSREGEVEMWSQAAMAEEEQKVMKRNFMGRGKEGEDKKKITQLAFGGNRMILARKDEMCLEVWQS